MLMSYTYIYTQIVLIGFLISFPIISYQDMKLSSAFIGCLLLIFIRPNPPQDIVLMRSFDIEKKPKIGFEISCCAVTNY